MIVKALSLLFLGIGIFVLVQVVMPAVAFKFWEVTAYDRDSVLLNPSVKRGDISGVSIENVGNFPAIVSNRNRLQDASYKDFKLLIPKIDLDWAKVVVDSKSFENNLAHLTGSALPGEKGNVFITGHSTLTQFYKPGNYKAVFSRLSELRRNDEIILEIEGQEFKYVVEGKKIVDPKDISVVNPPDSQGRYLTLMTCVPPGFNTKRLIILAKLK